MTWQAELGTQGWAKAAETLTWPLPLLFPSSQAKRHCWLLARWACHQCRAPSCLPPAEPLEVPSSQHFTLAALLPLPQHPWASHPRHPQAWSILWPPAQPHLLLPSYPRAHQPQPLPPQPLPALSPVPQVGVGPTQGGMSWVTQEVGSSQAWLSQCSFPHQQVP